MKKNRGLDERKIGTGNGSKRDHREFKPSRNDRNVNEVRGDVKMNGGCVGRKNEAKRKGEVGVLSWIQSYHKQKNKFVLSHKEKPR